MDKLKIVKMMKDKEIPEDKIKHGEQVCDLAVKIASNMEKVGAEINYDDLMKGALIHDAGFARCKGEPLSISIFGKINATFPDDVLLHGIYGVELAKEMGLPKSVQLIVLRHEIIAITRDERAKLGILPLPPEDTIPVTWEEKAVMYADGLLFLVSTAGLDLWKDPEAPAKGLIGFLQGTIGKLSKEPITLKHTVLQRANRLNAELKEFADPKWLV